MPAPGQAPAPHYFDKLGRRWNFVREVTDFSPRPAIRRASPHPGPSSVELDAMSDYAFADRMRGITLHAGRYEYIQAEPDLERMKEARALERARATLRALRLPSGDYRPVIDSKGVQIPLLRASLGLPEAESSAIPNLLAPAAGQEPRKDSALAQSIFFEGKAAHWAAAELIQSDSPKNGRFDSSLTKHRIIGPAISHTFPFDGLNGSDSPEPSQIPLDYFPPDDNRQWVSHSDASTWGVYKSAVNFGSGLCSGRLVGASIVLSAAHCFYNWGTPGSWMAPFNWITAGQVHTEDLSTFPSTYQYTYAAVLSNCYSVTVSSSCYTGGFVGDDWAIVDFDTPTCYSGQPGSGGRSVPIGIGVQAEYEGTTSAIEGYDSSGPLPPTPPGIVFGSSLITRNRPAGNIWYAPDLWVGFQHSHGTTEGASGAGLRQQLFWLNYGDPTWYATGIHSGGPSQLVEGCKNTSRNCGRRITWSVYNSIVW